MASAGGAGRSRAGRRTRRLGHPLALSPRVPGHHDPPADFPDADTSRDRPRSGGRLARIAVADDARRRRGLLAGAAPAAGGGPRRRAARARRAGGGAVPQSRRRRAVDRRPGFLPLPDVEGSESFGGVSAQRTTRRSSRAFSSAPSRPASRSPFGNTGT